MFWLGLFVLLWVFKIYFVSFVVVGGVLFTYLFLLLLACLFLLRETDK